MSKVNKNFHYGFIPGCSLASYNPEGVAKTVQYLDSVLPEFSVILKCCGKPTRDIGQQELFEKRFAGMKSDIKDVGVEEMILACPNCKKVFDQESDTVNHTLWEILLQVGIPEDLRGKAKNSDMVFTIHDSCAARNDRSLQDGIRWLLTELGYRYVESEYSREKTKCCGFGARYVRSTRKCRQKS